MSSNIITTTKKPENNRTAAVMLHVDLRFGQRTCFSSVHDPLKYPPIARRTLTNPFWDFAFTTIAVSDLLVVVLSFWATFLLLFK